MSKTRTVLIAEGATHIRVSASAKDWINKRAKTRNVAAWVIVDELIKKRGVADASR